ncbi:hypothetical protein EMCG_01335 [[Emmonsia] crescens]|uniref:Uncharacterized protein n=1 Tax=[Emmonsia] crescens TaxID=73230 RepID=A0A0G2I4D0_9EURO|nr:hypothetical protein EMCG_01335 [Emmonsia crescens UAMH 3008]
MYLASVVISLERRSKLGTAPIALLSNESRTLRKGMCATHDYIRSYCCALCDHSRQDGGERHRVVVEL